jgi:hypothetical protein
VLKFRVLLGSVLACATIGLSACGGGGSSGNGNVRLLNATTTHPSLTMLANGATATTATAIDTVSDYASVPSGGPALQVNDASTGSALATLAPSIAQDSHNVVVAYEGGGIFHTTVIAEDVAAPAAGTIALRILDAATDAGAIDVYVTDPSVDIATLTSPTFTFPASTSLQTSPFLSFAPGTYRVRVTGNGNPSDLRLDVASVTLTNQEIASLILTPTIGGTLVNASLLAQQGANTPGRNTTARVRLAAAVSGNAVVSASVAGTAVAASVVAPAVTGYAVVPAGTPLNISVNGATVASPVTALAPGGDSTLMVYGDPSTVTASLITDDNRLPALTTSLKLRMVNGLTGAATPLTLNAAFAVVASNVAPGAASPYGVLSAATPVQLDVFTPSNPKAIYSTANTPPGTGAPLLLPGNSVFTLFMLGDASAVPPIALLRKDR